MLKYRAIGLTIVFCGLMAFPIINKCFNIIHDSENLENRSLARKPELNINYLDPFPALYEFFYNDNFTLRSRMVRSYNLFKIAAFKKSPFPEHVIIGKNGWLYFAEKDIHTYRGVNPLSEKELNEIKLELEYRRDFIESKGGKFYFMIAPGKANIYPDNIPYMYYRFSDKCWGEQVNEYLRTNSDINCIDVYDTLRSKKAQGIYYKLDTHWNELGAFYAASEFARHMKRDFPEMDLMNLSDFKILESEKKDGNCTKILGFPPMLSDVEKKLIPTGGWNSRVITGFDNPYNRKQAFQLEKKENRARNKPKMLIAGDSFCNWFFPFAAEYAGKSMFTADFWEYKLNKDIIEDERPDVYLLIIHEPLIRAILSHQSRLATPAN